MFTLIGHVDSFVGNNLLRALCHSYVLHNDGLPGHRGDGGDGGEDSRVLVGGGRGAGGVPGDVVLEAGVKAEVRGGDGVEVV